MDEVLTIDEINERYPNEWVLIGDPQQNDSLEVLGGRVLYHSKLRDKVYQKAADLPTPGHLATHYTGTLFDDDVVYVL